MSASERDAAITTAASAGCGKVAEQARREQQHEDDRGGSDESGDLGPGAALEGDGGPRSAGADREALEEPGGDAGRSDAHHLAVPVDLGAGLVGEHGRRGDGVGQGDQGDAERAGEQQGQVPERHRGEGERREARRQLADEGDAAVLEVEHGHGDDREDDRGEDAREDRPQALEDDDQHQAHQPDRERGADRLPTLDRLGEGDGFVDQAVGVHGEPEQLGQLTDEDGEREAVHVTDLGRLREQVGDEAEPEHAGQHGDRTHHQREGGAVRDGRLRASVRCRERDDGRRDHRAEGRVRAEHEDPGRPEQGIADQREDGRVETGDGRQPGQLGVRHPLRDQQGRDHETGDQVLAEEGRSVGPEHRQARHRT